MKFIVSNAELSKAINSISSVPIANNVIKILENFLFKVNNSKLTITATDGDTRASVTIDLIESDGEGEIVMPSKLLQEYLKNVPYIPIAFNMDTTGENNYQITISAGSGVYRMVGMDAENYPTMPQIPDARTVKLNSTVLSTALEYTLFCAAVVDYRQILTGVNFDFRDEKLNVVSTDSHRLVRYRRFNIETEEDFNFVVKRKPLQILRNLIDTDTDVEINFNETNVSFEFENIMISCKLLEGVFPDYDRVIPPTFENKLLIDKESFISALKRVAVFTDKATNQIRMHIEGQEITLSGNDEEYANEGIEKLPCTYEGQDMDISFNSKTFMEMLQHLDCDNIYILMNKPNTAIVITPAEENESEDIVMLHMPISLKGSEDYY
ncbi:MAG: DNA polymerase III subunit beta [Bacteroidales bacterium]|jgi:DNA polymerase-3 subunit beta|nr:DNA polymerase III subunit beta [Bacteroidales bacterium]MDI9574917.1 DNA polymerase III subunit beta [Bacteroidota bacterium]MDD3755846.1 DNA polymerase III subunit beta [Bacteroidales bacterium]MDY0400766.1 DNA polymerase III subunit beta [Bacteroidales bacterium]HHW59268.1 DNA polymerase III subunit beta [Bacteroidales bacterium]